MASGALGQDFEWVRTYTGSDLQNMDWPVNDIKGSFVDAQGNIYIVGNISSDGSILGVDLLPQGVFSNRPSCSVVVAKISPQGQLVWHKAIYHSLKDQYALSLCRMGDTAFMVMLIFCPMDYRSGEYIYYLDTLITTADTGFFLPQFATRRIGAANMFLTFDLDGNVLERHILEVGYKDSSGQDVTFRISDPCCPYIFPNLDALSTTGLTGETFAVDHDGNIYVARHSFDRKNINVTTDSFYTISCSDGSISALKIMVDGRDSLVYPLTQRTPLWNQQILKFAPHFDSLLGGVYLYDTPYIDTTVSLSDIISMEVDRDNNLYVTLQYCGFPSKYTHVANSDSLFVRCDTIAGSGCVVVYSPDLRPTDVIQPAVIEGGYAHAFLCGGIMGHSCYFDYETKSLFVSGGVDGFWSGLPTMTYKGDTIYAPNVVSAFWLRLDMDSHKLLSYGMTRQTQVARDNRHGISFVAAKNNRVFSEIRFWHLLFADTMLTSPHDGIAFAVWDYDGHELQIENYNISSSRNLTRQIHLLDSAVYLTGTFVEDATFGSIVQRVQHGSSKAHVARYVDTSFMRPYVWHETREPQTIVWQQEPDVRLADRAVPLTATTTSGLPVRYVSLDRAVAYVRGDSLHFVAAGTATVTALQEGDRQYQPAQRVSKHFTVRDGTQGTRNVEGGDKRDGMTLYPNPTAGTLHIECPDGGLEGAKVSLLSTLGHYERVPLRRRSDSHMEADLSHLAAGIYYLQLASATKVYTEKVIVLKGPK
ncbi:MAG: T9SS type A sorting domain-containing protein [Bacteroidales bacterium]|nr:T9SS type A sorting domain-containing protein [Bacteroidales bacterium]